MITTPNIELADVSKSFALRRDGRERRGERRTVVSGLDLTVAAGECVGLLGSNGAGKSTVVRMICGLFAPDAGSVHVLGISATKMRPAHRRRLGVVFGQKNALWWDLTVRANLAYACGIYRVPSIDRSRRTEDLLEVLGLSSAADTPIRNLSLGERVKTEIASVLVSRPSLLILDEPTIGVDVSSKALIRDHLRREMLERGCSILLTSHDTADIVGVASKVVLLQEGTTAFTGSLDELRQRLGVRTEVVLRRTNSPFAGDEAQVAAAVFGPLGGLIVAAEGDEIRMVVPTANAAAALGQLPTGFAEQYLLEEMSLEDGLAQEFDRRPTP